MDDSYIIELYFGRDEAAIAETQKKYGRYCHAVARNILQSREDAEECVSDAYIGAWNAIPPHRPQNLGTFLGRITRNLALKRLREKQADKRGGGEAGIALHELEECVPGGQNVDGELLAAELAESINTFLASLSDNERRVFVCRYWHFDSVADISSRFGFTRSRVKMILKRTRDRLRSYLEKEGYFI